MSSDGNLKPVVQGYSCLENAGGEVMRVYLALCFPTECTSQQHTSSSCWDQLPWRRMKWNVTDLQLETQSGSRDATRGCFIYSSRFTNCGDRVRSRESNDRASSADKEADYTKSCLSSSLTPCLYKNRMTEKVRGVFGICSNKQCYPSPPLSSSAE